ncbi:hypothetical protein BDB00DRAFT_760418, partial [Zychaea mexicana]|uniref:uncharacterized protein n=1 Tax=Zychaea mexicana TaxID=64656 RepID=UPI0022FDB7CB
SLSELHSFASLKNLNMLSKVGHCFWNHCNVTDATPNFNSTGNEDSFVVPISDLMLSLTSLTTKPMECHHNINIPFVPIPFVISSIPLFFPKTHSI